MMRFLRKGDCYALNKPIKKNYYQSLSSFKCLLLSLSSYCYQFSCNVQESRASGTTGYGSGRRGILTIKERLLRIARSDARLLLTIFCVLFSSLAFTQAAAQTQAELVLRGEVRSAADGQAIEGASIIVDKKHARTDKEGRFTISVNKPTGTLTVKHIGYNEQKIAYENTATLLKILLETSSKQIEEVEVVSTGYQKIPKERATGSFEFIDSALFNRKVSTDFVSRLEDVVPGISSLKTFRENKGRLMGINIRGVSSMKSNIWPLVVIDGVPYQNNFNTQTGYFMNINPNDVENVTVLKDAAAASIWGAQSANGVIVITTKRGKFNQPFNLSVNSNVTVGQKPNLYYYPQMNTSDYIDAERFLFDNGYWDSRMYDFSLNLTPVIQLLKRHKEGDIGADALEKGLDALRSIDMREDFNKYIYRNSVNQQYNVQLSGGSEKINTSFSIGYDKTLDNVVTSSYNRFTAKNNTQLRPIKNLILDLGVTYTDSKRKDAQAGTVGYNLMGRGQGNFPYMRMADDDGNPLVVDAIGFNPIFRDTVAGGRLLDWKYRPLAELDQTHVLTNIRETFLNVKGNYQIFPELSASILYAFQHAAQPEDTWNGMGSSAHRSDINYRASWDDNQVIWGLPVGDNLYKTDRYNMTNQGRFQLDFNRDFGLHHSLNAIAGFEIREIKSKAMTNVLWGYDPENFTYKHVTYDEMMPALNGLGGMTAIYDFSQSENYTNRFTSYFANAAYTYKTRYTLSGSVRKDASNLFGVKTNDRAQPFWSLGAAWSLSNESFMDNDVIQVLKLRATYGYNGNVNNKTAAYPIINIQSSPHFSTGQPYATMQSPPNPSLRWERVGVLNMGLDFAIFHRLSGSLEYYIKKPKDLIASSSIDPTTGYSSLNINSSNLDGRGVDLSLNSVNINTSLFSWRSNLVMAYNRTKVTKSYLSNTRSQNYLSGAYNMLLTPVEGMDLYSLLTHKWAGLDPETGMPRGYVNGEVSDDYGTIVNRSTVYDLENHGALRPKYFGSFRNSLSYKNIELSFNISYQLGHKFLRSSFVADAFIEEGVGHSDYALRWQNPGDELKTDVPTFMYPNNYYASEFYRLSAALVEPADQIKWRDLQVSYGLKKLEKVGLKNMRIYAYAQNLGVIWRANKLGIDPEYGSSFPEPFSLSLGLNFNL
ncbi:SusC/RagA family TonB-linked outer membrane protein [Sphingobacterium sp. UT-1RO-CII-1]|uniref:SusC/RagA family TonB-linked outer membrane protein n=1 Tax=Sphingobacterium sp. UT-1RO-CII-1 TaxID=2995225 RepID=UPI00227BF147|nr:SusC/RagA family TonB-linked outer membrane protein [Sphingobacterium sp. UT-1RO-CII-1]MCY4779074.1 SusC/RagA family TonB-linked outer membrane protein [Sphingobacterium sp. UT-1RO-CII-1]